MTTSASDHDDEISEAYQREGSTRRFGEPEKRGNSLDHVSFAYADWFKRIWIVM